MLSRDPLRIPGTLRDEVISHSKLSCRLIPRSVPISSYETILEWIFALYNETNDPSFLFPNGSVQEEITSNNRGTNMIFFMRKVVLKNNPQSIKRNTKIANFIRI